MLTLPIPLLLSLLLGLVSLGILAAGPYLLYQAYRHRARRAAVVSDAVLARGAAEIHPRRVVMDPAAGHHASMVTAPLVIGIALLFLSLGGRYLFQFLLPAGQDEPNEARTGEVQYVTAPDGTRLRAEFYGRPGGPTLLLTHGWGTNSTEWYYAKKQLGQQFRLIVWDLPGLGESAQPQDRNFTLDRMATDLHAVLPLANGKPVVLVGHSIGGMVNLTFCRLFPQALGTQVAGIAQVDTSYTNPVKTTQNSQLSEALQKPVGEPVLHAMIWFSPLVRIMNWFSYQNGGLYLMNAKSGFAGSETRGQVDLISRYQVQSSPAVIARGTLGMFHWDASPVLPQIHVPVLILVGAQDTTTLPSASQHMHDTIPQSQLVSVSPSAHYGLLEQNVRFNEKIAEFSAPLLK